MGSLENPVYTAQELRRWETDAEYRPGRYSPARPIWYWSFSRFKVAWCVLIGRYDALDWEDQ